MRVAQVDPVRHAGSLYQDILDPGVGCADTALWAPIDPVDLQPVIFTADNPNLGTAAFGDEGAPLFTKVGPSPALIAVGGANLLGSVGEDRFAPTYLLQKRGCRRFLGPMGSSRRRTTHSATPPRTTRTTKWSARPSSRRPAWSPTWPVMGVADCCPHGLPSTLLALAPFDRASWPAARARRESSTTGSMRTVTP